MDSLRVLNINVIRNENINYEVQTNEDEDSDVIPKHRQRTDLPFFILQCLCLFLLVFLIAYCVVYGDIDRLVVGYDKCGNVCGKLNKQEFDFPTNCRAEDMSAKPFLNLRHLTCVDSCPEGTTVFGRRCIYSGHTSEITILESIGQDLHTCYSELIILSLLALGFSFVMFLVLRYMTAAFVWTTLFGVIAMCASLTGYLWYLTDYVSGLSPLAAFVSCLTFIVVLIIIFLRKRINLVIQLLKEAGKAISAVPVILVEPVLTFIAIALLICVWIFFTLWIESAGIPKEEDAGVIKFHKNGLINFTRWFNVFSMLWMMQFMYGCHNMIVAGTVSNWYFTRNKLQLKYPLLNSIKNTFVYHLGTTSLGGLIITLILMLRLLMRFMRRSIHYPLYLCCLCCIFTRIEMCLNYLEDFIKYLTNNAYIVTAIYGTPFYESGVKAFNVLCNNALRIIAINSVGDFVFILAKILIVLSTILVGVALLQNKEHLDSMWPPIIFIGIIALLISHCFIIVYEMAVDTVFICFCEDCELNDGMARPYYMSQGLMEFVEKSKMVLNVKDVEVANVSAINVA